MHILLEEEPLLVYYFLTLFLSNYKLRLILSIFWTKLTFCQLALTCSLTLSNSLVPSLCFKFVCAIALFQKIFHKIVSSDVLHIQGTSALECSTLLLGPFLEFNLNKCWGQNVGTIRVTPGPLFMSGLWPLAR